MYKRRQPSFSELMLEMPRQIALLTGAGASKPLGLKVMSEMVDDKWRAELRGDLHAIYDLAANWAVPEPSTSRVDFELLYTAIDALVNMEPLDLVALPFAPHRGSSGMVFQTRPGHAGPIGFEAIVEAAGRLREQLRYRVHELFGDVEAEEATQLLLPLFDKLISFQNGPRDLLLFTTNYDRAVEGIWDSGLEEQSETKPRLVWGFKPGAGYGGLQFDPTVYDEQANSREEARVQLW